jgi:CHAT domain-containing protein
MSVRRPLFVLPWLLCAALTSSLGAQEDLVSGEAIIVELSDAEPSMEFTYEVQGGSVVYLYAESDTLDPNLLVEDDDLELLGEDDNSGGGTSAHLELEGTAGDVLWITLGLAESDDSSFDGEIRVKLTEVPRLAAPSLPQLEEARRWIDQSSGASSRGEYERARQLARQAVDRLEAIREPLTGEVALALFDAGSAAFDAQDASVARDAWEPACRFWIRTLPNHHPDVQNARSNLALTIKALGDLEGARVLQEKVLEVRTQTLPDHHPDLLWARNNLAATIRDLGDLEGARVLQEKVLEIETRTLPDHHPDLQSARSNLAVTIRDLGDLEGARVLEEKVLEVQTQTLPDHHPDLQRARNNLAWTRARLREGLSELIDDLARGTKHRIETFGSLLSPRELRVLADQERSRMSSVLSLSRLPETFHKQPVSVHAFSLVETMRGVEPSSMRFQRGLVRVEDDELRRLRGQAARANQALVRHSQGERSSSTMADAGNEAEGNDQGDELDRFQKLLRAKEAAESQVSRYAASLLGAERPLIAGSPEDLAAVLEQNAAAIGFWRYTFTELDEETREQLPDVSCYLAHVLLGDGTLARVELGPADVIDDAVKEWRTALRAHVDRGVMIAGDAGNPELEAGERLRDLIFDPLVPHLGSCTKLIVALDDALHLVPLVALPHEDGVLGDRYEFSLRTTLRELMAPPSSIDSPPSLLALGGVEYDLDPELAAAAAREATNRSSGGDAGALRTAAWRDFGALLATSDEVDLVAHYFGKKHKSAEVTPEVIVLKEEEASRESLELLAPNARYLHLATHGYFLDESVPSMADERVIDEALGVTASRNMGQQVRGYLPMTLCGLALAGANVPANELGRVPGILTAQELAGWNLDHCELAVLSACDSNVGVRRAGQGIASLQEALYAAGVRASITSLWKVPDRATQELFTEFYRRLWLRGENKAQALWNAQQKLRRAKDPDGEPIYRTRDWAAWVLVGDPD